MIGEFKLKPYSAYKDSGSPFIGLVPSHWEIRRYKYLLREVQFRSESGSEGLLRVSQYTGVTRCVYVDDGNTPRVRGETLIGYKLVEPRDLVINIMLAWNGSLGVSSFQGVVSPAYCVYRFIGKGTNPRFFHYLLRVPAMQAYFRAESTGIVQHRLRLYPNDLYRIGGVLPSLDEQVYIVRFLDYIDGKIQRCLDTKRKLIELLEEQRYAIIRRIVTRGLDPNIRPKLSGIDWLGQVPEHWDVAALRHRYEQSLGKMLDSSRITGEHLVPYLRNVDVQWDMINIANLPLMDIRPSEIDRYTVRAGDLLVCEGGETGRCAIWDGSVEVCGYQKALHRLRPVSSDQDSARFLYYAFRVAANRGAFKDGRESTIAHLTGEKIRSHRFAFPPLEEQLRIVKFLDFQVNKISRLISIERRLIDLLGEYRTRLISDVVTGKLDVREAAAQLPKQLSETGSVDAAHAPPHMSTGSDRDSDASTEECEP